MARENLPGSGESAPGSSAGAGGKPQPSLIYNYHSLIGLGIIAIGFFTGLITLFLDVTSPTVKAYSGIFYLLYLMLILLGAANIPIGILRERRRRRPGGTPSLTGDLVVDLRLPSHRNMLIALVGFAALMAVAVTVGAYRSYQATESNNFCGQLCHVPMQPEWTTYNYSSHARVKCVECHIGSGAGWYVRSKLSGIRQIFAVTLNTFPRPIPTPIENLRPARETCEECHWPKKFIGYKDIARSYFLSDEKNTPYRIRLLMKIGGEESSLMRGAGIHYHMLIAHKVQYIARDHKRQQIAFVRVTGDDGTPQEYEDSSDPLSEEAKASLPLRTMDCMDCHNRPSHQFPTPMHIVNQAMEVEKIPTDLPRIKVVAVRALDQEYGTTPDAMLQIERFVLDYYKEEFPEVYENRGYDLARAIFEIQNIFQRTIFPEMGASWATYPDNIGHRDYPGCFRCHNDRMESESGKTIFTTCNKCHLILAQGPDISRVAVDLEEGLTFQHPGEDGEDIEEYTECTDCHTGGSAVYD